MLGIPPNQVLVESARPGVPDAAGTPGLVWNTHASQICCPEDTDTGLSRGTVCQPVVPLTVVVLVTLRRAPGVPALSLYTARII